MYALLWNSKIFLNSILSSKDDMILPIDTDEIVTYISRVLVQCQTREFKMDVEYLQYQPKGFATTLCSSWACGYFRPLRFLRIISLWQIPHSHGWHSIHQVILRLKWGLLVFSRVLYQLLYTKLDFLSGSDLFLCYVLLSKRLVHGSVRSNIVTPFGVKAHNSNWVFLPSSY